MVSVIHRSGLQFELPAFHVFGSIFVTAGQEICQELFVFGFHRSQYTRGKTGVFLLYWPFSWPFSKAQDVVHVRCGFWVSEYVVSRDSAQSGFEGVCIYGQIDRSKG
jgi:hypothetical protein